MDFPHRQLYADDSRGRREHPVWTYLELLCHPDANARGCPQSLLAGGAIGIAGVHY